LSYEGIPNTGNHYKHHFQQDIDRSGVKKDGNTVESIETECDRDIPDRRRRPTPMLSRYSFFGRRKYIRRDEDKDKHIYVDRYSLRTLLFILAILLLGIADAILTLYHINTNQAKELNPIMDFFLRISPHIFFNVKYVVTALCLLVLCLHKNLPIVKHLLNAVFVIYLIIIINHIYLFFALS